MFHAEAQLPIGEDDEGEGFVKPAAEESLDGSPKRQGGECEHPWDFWSRGVLQGEEGAGESAEVPAQGSSGSTANPQRWFQTVSTGVSDLGNGFLVLFF